LDFADDVALIGDSAVALQNMTSELQDSAAKVELRIFSAEKIEAMAVGNTQAPSLECSAQEHRVHGALRKPWQ